MGPTSLDRSRVTISPRPAYEANANNVNESVFVVYNQKRAVNFFGLILELNSFRYCGLWHQSFKMLQYTQLSPTWYNQIIFNCPHFTGNRTGNFRKVYLNIRQTSCTRT